MNDTMEMTTVTTMDVADNEIELISSCSSDSTDAATASSSSEPNSTLEAMLRQEDSYRSDDYLYHQDNPATVNGPLHMPQQDAPQVLKEPKNIEDDRGKMVGWQYQVADFCRFDRETVAIATCYFDRFLASENAAEALTNTDLFQLAAMTCLYTAAKIHEPESFEPWMLSKMSRGLYQPEQVEKMEMVILQAIQWRVNPPTAMAFCREYLACLPETYLTQAAKTAVHDLCKFQVELSVRMYQFVPVKASVIAMAALLNALESMGMDYATLTKMESFLSECCGKQVCGVNDSLADIQERLYQAVTEFSGIHTEVSTTSAYPAKQTLCGKRACYNVSPCGVQLYTAAA